MSLIFIFIDGVGLALAGPDNPLTDADTPALRALLGGPLTIEQVGPPRIEDRGWRIEDRRDPPSSILHPQILFKAIDATLGVAGLPQSGTGHTALLVGINAAELHGRHQPHFPPVALRGLLSERSIFRRIVDRGGQATFANAFGPGYWQAVESRRIRKSASVIAAEGGGLRFRDGDDLRAGRAVSWDVTNAAMRLREPGTHTPLVAPEVAGANLARLAHDYDLVFYESFLPDLAGHGRLTTGDERSNVRTQVHAALHLLDGLIGGALDALRPTDTLLMTSDHGNVESLAAPAHTHNPVPLLVVGPGAQAFAKVESIAEVADVVVEVALKR
jgi:2,3-bisphosphoglycerate-independent phosphoglycerate mutase